MQLGIIPRLTQALNSSQMATVVLNRRYKLLTEEIQWSLLTFQIQY